MKKNLLKATLITTLGAVTLSCTEQGVIIDREDLPEEKAFFVNVIRQDKSKQKSLEIQSDEVYNADRKLFFCNAGVMDSFMYGAPGDTIVYYNPLRKTFINVHKNQIRSINGIGNHDIARQVRIKQR